ncbi:uncharacterized protein LOC132548554 [Ylistrum balloti]|uniref:uncharacterized protein LOC132548554 n=1 Tax=Ylistrum balloti TaxID=509963 RepID=UPI002905CE32|nr:uncharacterized protein LOC132548554 [Ylistrum balloti]
MKLCFALAFLVCGSCALTVEEAKKFRNDGQYGGRVSYTDNGDSITLTSNGLPDHAFEKVNPNELASRNDVYTVPKDPQIGTTTGCLSMGPIGMTVTGSMIYDPLNAQGQNAVEGPTQEQFDSYGGHTDPQGIYHYHKIPGSWLYTGEADELLGVAFDGFPIYGPMASDLGRDVTNKDLDECHGRMVNGKYRYHANTEFPYYLGCYKGSTVNRARTTYGNCTDKSGLPEYGYVCTCAREGPGQLGGMGHQGSMGQQSGMYQPINGQYQQLPQQHETQASGTDNQQHFYPPMPNQQHPSDRPIVPPSQPSGTVQHPYEPMHPFYPEHHHMQPPPDGHHYGPLHFGNLLGKRK